MKALKVIIPVALIVLLAFSWFTSLSSTWKTASEYNRYIRLAESSYDDGLYDQAVEYYKQALELRNNASTYYKIKEADESHYEEEHTESVRSSYISDMEAAASEYPGDAVFCCTAARLYMDAENYSAAYKCAKRGKNHGARSEELDEIIHELTYMTKLESRVYYAFYSALNGYISVDVGDFWRSTDTKKGDQLSADGVNQYIGVLNDDGYGIYVMEKETRLIDGNGIVRARFDFVAQEAGCYDKKSGLTPVKINDKWQYIRTSGELCEGKYEAAGSFCDGKAAVYDGKSWFIIDENLKRISDKSFEDIKLDLYGNCLQNDIILAKENGKYHIYSDNLSQKNDFECDDIDICITDKLIAYKSGDKWGYVDADGKVAIEPEYDYAKSFSQGLAAVANKDGKWGFIDEKGELVIDYEYKDAFYFGSDKKCMVSVTEGTYQFLEFIL